MAAQINDDSDDVISAINVTPFVDIVLVLLIVLMVTSTAIVRASIQVDLPKAASGGETVDATINIVYTQDKKTYLDGALFEDADLDRAFKSAFDKDPKVRAVISADKGLDYGSVVRLIDRVKGAGIVAFALNIDQESKR